MRLLLSIGCLIFCAAAKGQAVKIGSIDIYGNRDVNAGQIYSRLGIQAGDSIQNRKQTEEQLTANLKKIPAIKQVQLSFVCCNEAGNTMLYIGIDETGSDILKHRDAPVGTIQLPAAILNSYHDFENAFAEGVRLGDAAENDSNGYALYNYAPARAVQLQFIDFANTNYLLLKRVLKYSSYASQRAAAATIMAYSAGRQQVITDLLYAVDDADYEVRNNAARALAVLAGYSNRHPELKISIPAAPFINMLQSINWTDRNKAAAVLMQLTQNRDAALLKEIATKALPALIEMATWSNRGHAAFAFIILGRIKGVDEALLGEKNFSAAYAAAIETMLKN